jgi:hypothetical protein
MAEFTFNVFLVVASLVGALIAVFTAGLVGALLSDAQSHRAGGAAAVDEDHAKLPRAA